MKNEDSTEVSTKEVYQKSKESTKIFDIKSKINVENQIGKSFFFLAPNSLI